MEYIRSERPDNKLFIGYVLDELKKVREHLSKKDGVIIYKKSDYNSK